MVMNITYLLICINSIGEFIHNWLFDKELFVPIVTANNV